MIKRGGGGGWAHWIVLWGFVAGAVFVGVKGLTEGLPKAPDYGPVCCNGEVMRSGDRCNIVSGGSVRNSNSYEKLRERLEAGRGAEPVLPVIGSVLILGGVGGGHPDPGVKHFSGTATYTKPSRPQSDGSRPAAR